MAELYRITVQERVNILNNELDYWKYKLNLIQLMKSNYDPADELNGTLDDLEKFYAERILKTEKKITNLITLNNQTLIIYTDGK